MIEIIPNWHPIFVHFTIGLFSAAVGFYVLAYLSQRFHMTHITWTTELDIVGRWCLWAASIVSIITVLAGLHAFNTVQHDEMSHMAMTNHRNWAIPTAGFILLIGIWSFWRHIHHKTLTFTFIIALLIGQGLLLSTAWRGAELVFRYGLGVLSLPTAEEVGHAHHLMSGPNSGQPNPPLQQSSTETHEHP